MGHLFNSRRVAVRCKMRRSAAPWASDTSQLPGCTTTLSPTSRQTTCYSLCSPLSGHQAASARPSPARNQVAIPPWLLFTAPARCHAGGLHVLQGLGKPP